MPASDCLPRLGLRLNHCCLLISDLNLILMETTWSDEFGKLS